MTPFIWIVPSNSGILNQTYMETTHYVDFIQQNFGMVLEYTFHGS